MDQVERRRAMHALRSARLPKALMTAWGSPDPDYDPYEAPQTEQADAQTPDAVDL
jgi:hypothetical protein